jgi:hypothetical protein
MIDEEVLIKFTLISDGSSDRVLMPIIKWLLDDLYPEIPNEGFYADLRGLKTPPRDLPRKVKTAVGLYPCHLLFIHRDGESNDFNIIEKRKFEIFENQLAHDNVVAVIPIKMTETWLLINEEAIKKAAGNPNYKGTILLPRTAALENEPNPKELLFSLLENASGLKGRNLDKFNTGWARYLVAENIEDFSILRALRSFQQLEGDVKDAVNKIIN